jgi:hypothetical protein
VFFHLVHVATALNCNPTLDPVKPVYLKLLMLPLVGLTGCRSVEKGAGTSEGPAFCEEEIRSKSWVPPGAPQTQRVGLLSWTSVSVPGFDELVVAGYGDRTSSLKCLELYHVVLRPSGKLLVPTPITSNRGSAHPAYAQKSVPQKRVFVLLAHDYRPGAVTSVLPEGRDQEVHITIIRKSAPGAAGQREGIRYTLICDNQYGVRAAPHIGTWDIPAEKSSSR